MVRPRNAIASLAMESIRMTLLVWIVHFEAEAFLASLSSETLGFSLTVLRPRRTIEGRYE